MFLCLTRLVVFSGLILLMLSACNVTVCSGDCDPDPDPDNPGKPALTSGSTPSGLLSALTHTGASSAQARARQVSRRQANALRKPAASTGKSWQFWLDSGFHDVDDDRYEADIESDVVDVTAGAAYRLGDRTIIGLATGYEELEATGYSDTAYVDQKSFYIGPYGSHKLSEHLIIDGWLGYRYVDGDSEVTNLRGSYDGDGYFLSTSLTGHFAVNGFNIIPKTSVYYGDTDIGSYSIKSAGDRATVADHEQTFGLIDFNIEANHDLDMAADLALTPFIRAGISYAFDRGIDDAFLDEDLNAHNPDRWRGSLEIGITGQVTDTVEFDLNGGYDGIGDDDYDIWMIRAAFSLPLN